MAITINILYSGENGTARKFAKEMTVERFRADDAAAPERDKTFIKE